MKKGLLLVWMLTLLLLVSFASAVPTMPDNADVVSYHALEDLTDNTGTHGLTDNAATSGATGIIDDAYSFADGPGHYLIDATYADVSAMAGVTMNFWANPDHTEEFYAGVAMGGRQSGAYEIRFEPSGSVSAMRYKGSDFDITSGTYTAGSFQMFTATFTQNGDVKLYKNGALVSTSTSTNSDGSTFTLDRLVFAAGGGTSASSDALSYDYDGVIDEVTIADTIWTVDEIEWMYNSGAPGSNQQYLFNETAAVVINHSIEQTVSIEQSSNVTIIGSSFQPVISGNFVTSLETNGTSTFVLNAFNNLGSSRDVTCRVDLNGDYYDTTITRTIPGTEYASYYLSSTNFSVDADTHDIVLECRNDAPGSTLTLNAFGIVHLYRDGVTNQSINFATYSINETINSSSFQKIASVNFTTTNRSVDENITKHIFLDGALQYDYDSTGTITLYASINGTDFGEYPRYGSGSSSGIVGGMFYAIPSNVANASQNITIDVYAKSSTSDGSISGQFTAKEMIMHVTEANTTQLDGLSFTGDSSYYNITTLSISNEDHATANMVVKAGIPHNATGGATVSDFRFILSNGELSAPISRTISAIDQAGVTIIQTEFFVGVGDYTVSLQGRADQNIVISGGDMLSYLSSVVDFDQSSFNVTIYDEWDNSSVIDFNVTLSSTGAIFESVGGVAIVTPSQALETLLINGDGFFNKTVNNHNINNDLNTSVSASEINFNAYEIITESLVTPSNFTVTDGITSKTVLDGVNLSLSPGNYNVTFSKTGWFNKTESFSVTSLDVKTVNITDVSSTVLNISAIRFTDSSNITNFSGTLFNSNFSITIPFSTTSGSVLVGVATGQTFEINISSTGYASISEDLLINISPIQNYTAILFPFNSVNIEVRDITNNSVIDWQSVSMAVIDNDSSFINTSSDGTFLVSLLTPEDYELRFSSVGYVTTSSFVTVLNDSTQNLVVYLDKNTTESQQIRVIDTGSNRVSGAIVRVQKEVLNSSSLWVTVSEVKTDSEGQAFVFIEKSPTVFYRFSVSLDSVPLVISSGGGLVGAAGTITGELFTSPTSFLSGISEIVQIIVLIDEAVDSELDNLAGIATNVTYTLNDTVVTYDFVDARSTIVGGQLLIWGQYLNSSDGFELLSNQTVLGSAGTITYTLPVINNTEYKVQAFILFETSTSLVHERIIIFGFDVLINPGTGLLLGIIVLAFIVLFTYIWGPLISSILFFAAMLPLAKFGLISIGPGIIVTLIAISVILFFRPRGTKP